MKNIRRLFCRIIFVVIIFYLGYGVGTLRLFSNRDVFVYDSPTKIRDFYSQIESAFQKEGLSINHPTTKKFIEELKDKPPLAVVGPLIIFYNKNNGDYS
ncbi:MAG: hypothetical protein LBJ67_09230 [Planctomycetaceae bacterium]|jgi:hypothetical protein|nr:hypothetical protein [Planctomycetaceae bacterium]